MLEQSLKYHAISIEQTLCETDIPQGKLVIYQTCPLGMVVVLNNEIILSEQDSFFYHEMITHPAIYSHQHAQQVAIIGNSIGIVEEVLKHTAIKQIACVEHDSSIHDTIIPYFSSFARKSDGRVNYHFIDPLKWFTKIEPDTFDVIIQAQASTVSLLKQFHRTLRADGILIHACEPFIWQANAVNTMRDHLKQIGFNRWQLLTFAQPSYVFGLRTLIMATKRSLFKRVREKEIFNRPFATRYYNFDMHKAALVLPEFMRERFEG